MIQNNISSEFELNQKEYQRIKSLAKENISTFYYEHKKFSLNNEKDVELLNKKYQNFNYKFRYVVRKYFMNVTFDYRKIPWNFIIPVFHFYILKKIGSRYNKKIETYQIDFIHRISEIKVKIPDLIEKEEDLSQVIKLIMACSLSCYIHLPFFKKKSHKMKLHKAYLAGFYYGIAYLISDKALDSTKLSLLQKEELHFELLHLLADPVNYKSNNSVILVLSQFINEDLPVKDFNKQYELLFSLQSVQYEEMNFKYTTFSDSEIIEKITLLALKTYLSLFIIQSFIQNEKIETSIKKHLQYSLLVQLDDDLRDIEKDTAENRRTFYNKEWTESSFNPHSLYLKLVEKICEKNPDLHWLNADYFMHQSRELASPSLDHEKIKVFLKKITGYNLEDIYNKISS